VTKSGTRADTESMSSSGFPYESPRDVEIGLYRD
jgi:hypothetical protein